jgi:hypothetical protein
MADEAQKPARLRWLTLIVVVTLYAVWATVFVLRSAAETSHGRLFCLFDDAMVSLRYAWNLAHGDGLVWNPGERVEGNTSFLFTLFMTLGALFFSKSGAALFVQVLAVPLVIGVALLAHKVSRSLGAPPWLALISLTGVLAYYPLSYWSLMGMETGLLTALSLAAALLAMNAGAKPQGSKTLGLLLGLMFATRPDAAVPAAVILAFRAGCILREQRRLGALRPWLVEPLVFVGILFGLTLFRLLYYGEPVPNTYLLKLSNWPIHWRLRNGWRFVLPFFESSRYLLLSAFLSLLLKRDGRRLFLVCFALSVIGCQIWVGGDAWTYWRMLVPAVVVLIVLTADAANQLVLLLKPNWGWAAWGFSFVSTAWALREANEPFKDEQCLRVPAYTVSMNGIRAEAALELSGYADRQASVAVFAAGVLPYYSGLRGVDAFGKSDRTIARLPGLGFSDGKTVTPGHNKFDLQYSIVNLHPDVIFDALAWARYDRTGILDYVQAHYVERRAFWFRRDSPHIHWDRVADR